jgi:hypothetical protein
MALAHVDAMCHRTGANYGDLRVLQILTFDTQLKRAPIRHGVVARSRTVESDNPRTRPAPQVAWKESFSIEVRLNPWSGAFVFLGPDALPGQTLPFGASILLALINIHHYFIDGCVWKISTPEVKKDLFRHLGK